MAVVRVEAEIGGRKLILETGKIAKQADGAVMVTYGDCVVLGTTVRAKPREGIDFFPLTVDYREKAYAAGKFPGGFFKREGRPTSKETLTMRMIDRPIRPLFPDGFIDEIQIQTLVMSADPAFDPDITAIVAGAASLHLSSAPFQGPVGAVRVARVDGRLIINPTYQQLEESDLDLVLAGHPDGVNMIEVGSKEISEEVMAEAIAFGYDAIKKICDLTRQLREQGGAKEVTWTPPAPNDALLKRLRDRAYGELLKRRKIVGKLERQNALKELYDAVLEEFSPKDAEKPEFQREEVNTLLHKLEEEAFTDALLETKVRTDGRGPLDIRQITCEVSILPRVHGSSLFQRGETQGIVVCTLGTARDEQIIDGLAEEYSKKFMLHYNFPPFSVGEARRISGPGRREIGHGALAERSLEAVLPAAEDFPYTIRLVSEITESNGSSSMASVCGGTLALMDAGVPILRPVAGISIGSVHKGDNRLLITDIIGEEDHFGDMDFKVSGTQKGITGIQLDLKERFISHENIVKALAQAKEARLNILRSMLAVLGRPRKDISPNAPRIITIKINPEKIGAVIGPGGKGIRRIEAESGASIDIEDDGTVMLSSLGYEGAQKAREMIEQITEGVKIGKIYNGRVSSIKDFGAFIEVAPGQDGLCHISELADGFVKSVTDVVRVGDEVRVKVINIDDQGRVKLSRKAAIREEGQNGDQNAPVGAEDAEGDEPQGE